MSKVVSEVGNNLQRPNPIQRFLRPDPGVTKGISSKEKSLISLQSWAEYPNKNLPSKGTVKRKIVKMMAVY